MKFNGALEYVESRRLLGSDFHIKSTEGAYKRLMSAVEAA
jgi:hypothetical protein